MLVRTFVDLTALETAANRDLPAGTEGRLIDNMPDYCWVELDDGSLAAIAHDCYVCCLERHTA